MNERDIGLLGDILKHSEEALTYMAGVSSQAYENDRRLQLITERLLEIIGEAARGLSQEAQDEVEYDWRNVRGLRNVLVHQYGSVVHVQIHRVVTGRLPGLVRTIRSHLD